MKKNRIALCFSALCILLVACGGGGGSSDSPSEPNPCPSVDTPCARANASQVAAPGSSVTLDGSDSRPADGDMTASFQWQLVSMPSGSQAAIENANSVQAMLTPDVAGIYEIRLTVASSGAVFSDTDTIRITANSAPVADAGPERNVATNTVVRLDGTASSDPDGDNLSFAWEFTQRPEGSAASLNDPSSPQPEFVPDLDGTYAVELVVTDRPGQDIQSESEPDTVMVTATTMNSAPVADAGEDQNVATGDIVSLDGSASSDTDGDPLTYQWTLTDKPSDSGAVLSEPTDAGPSFTADLEGEYTFELVVSDGEDESNPDSVTITATFVNVAPNADAGEDRTIFTGQDLTLDGSDSNDANNDPLTFQWEFISIPDGAAAQLSDRQSDSPLFESDSPGTYLISLTVSDGQGETDTDNVAIRTVAPSVTLFLVAGADTFNEVPFPYDANASVTVPGGEDPFNLETFRIIGIGTEFSIADLTATDANMNVTPRFVGLEDGMILGPDQELIFTLQTPDPGPDMADLTFSFTVENDDGDPVGTFLYEATVD